MNGIFYSRLKSRRDSYGWSQDLFARKIATCLNDDKFRQQHYQRIESGNGEPTLSQLIAICKVLAVSADWLLGICSDTVEDERRKSSITLRIADVKENAEQATASIKALQSAIEKLNNTI